MPRASTTTRAVIPPATIAAVTLMRSRIRELRALNGERTELTEGHIVGLVEAEAFILEATCDAAGDPASPL